MYIALEGVKGTGKTTVFTRLREALLADGIPLSVLCPTRPVSPPNLVERMARVPALRGWDAFRERLYAMRSNHHARRTSRPPGALLLGDRSRLTSYVTRWDGASADTRRACLARVDAMEPVIGLPDHVLYLDAPPEVLRDRLDRRDRHYGREDETPARLTAQRSAYDDLRRHATELGLAGLRWHRIDAGVGLDEVVDQCLHTARTLFRKERLS